MLRTLPLKTYEYPCSRLRETVAVNTFAAYRTESLDEYPLDCEIPFGATSNRMFCSSARRCGVVITKNDETTAEFWHLCPALACLKEKLSLPEA
jgi:hypothetical protein